MFRASRRIPTLLLFLSGYGILTSSVRGAEKERAEPSIPVLRSRLLDKSAVHLKDRCDAARALGRTASAHAIREQQIVEALYRVARDRNDDPMVRLEAIDALGRLPTSFCGAYGHYAVPFAWILLDEQEEEFLRAKSAWLLGRTFSLHLSGIDEVLDALTEAVRRRDEALSVKVACVDALSQIGSRRVLDLSASELPRLYLEPILQERLLNALGRALAERGDTSGLAPSLLVNRVTDLAFSAERPAEVRAAALVVLACLKKAQMAGAVDLMPEIRGVVKFGQDPVLLLAAVQAAGILNDENTPTALVEAYRSLAVPGKAQGADDVRIRTQIVRSLGEWLSAQTRLRSPDAKGIRLIAGLLLEIAGPAKDNKETAVVRYETFLALRYLYPNRREFSPFHQGIAEQLIGVLREEPKANAELTAVVVETLTIISRYPGGRDLNAWEKWYSRTYHGSEIAKLERPLSLH